MQVTQQAPIPARGVAHASARPRRARCRAVRGPPADYDFRAESTATSIQLIEQQHPEILDLARSGTLVAVPRRSDYAERRTDGYKEPDVVYLVGTAHVSRQSGEDVQRVIQAVRPQNVVVELCSSRTAIMYDSAGDPSDGGSSSTSSQATDASDSAAALAERRASSAGAGASDQHSRASNPMALSGGGLLTSFARTLQLGGTQALILRLLLGRMSGRLSEQIGVRSGEEFRAARRAAEGCDAQLVLGDRPIEVTLRRAWDALSLQQRWRLGRRLASSASPPDGVSIDVGVIEALKDDDAISAFFAELSREFPELLGPLIHERDVYLAWSLKRSKAVNGCQRVVGVMGKGHLRGVVHALTHDQGSLRFRDLAGGRRSKPQAAIVARRVAAEVALAAGLTLAWLNLRG